MSTLASPSPTGTASHDAPTLPGAGTLPDAPRRAPHIATLVAAAAVGALATTMFVPSMPSIAADLGASYASVQVGLSGFLVVTAFVQLACGPMSDVWGRRPVLMWSLAIYLAGSVMCVVAPSIEWFLGGRLLQGAGAAGIVLSRTIIRDLYARERAASMIGYTIMAMAVAPMLGPWLGGTIDEAFGWRATFVLLTAFGAATLAAFWFDLPETNRDLGRPVAAQIASYRVLLRTRAFWVFTATGAFTSATFYGFLGAAPLVSSQLLAMGPSDYGLWFAFCAAGYMGGNFLSGRFAERVGLARMVLAGSLVTLLGPIAMATAFWLGIDHPFSLFGWSALVGVGNGMVLPSNIAAAISIRPDAAGASSGLLGTLQTLTGAAASVVTAAVVGDGTRAVAFSLTIVVFAVGAVVFAVLSARLIRRGEAG